MSGTCLILFAHGSKDPRWRSTFERLEADLQRDLGRESVRLAYMEFAEPSLEEVASGAVERGVHSVRILPLFLAGGAHLSTDLPEQVAAVEKAHPDLKVEVLPPIGEHPRFAELIQALARETAS